MAQHQHWLTADGVHALVDDAIGIGNAYRTRTRGRVVWSMQFMVWKLLCVKQRQ